MTTVCQLARWRGAAALVAVVALASSTATGCGRNSSSASSASSAAADQGGSSAGAPEEFGLTLTQLAERVEETERLISDCMTRAGFEYVALDFASVKKAMDSDQTAPGVSGEDYVKRFGLGITTQLEKPIVTFRAGPQNNTYLDGLPPSDQVAFRRALWGEAVEWNHARSLEEEDFSQAGGCTRASAERTYKPAELTGTYVNPADTLVQQDPRMIAAFKKWSECMRADGFAYDHPDQVDRDLRERLATIAKGQNPATLTGPSLDALRDLQGQELAVAALLTSCEEDFIEPVEDKVQSEIFGSRAT